MQSKVCVAIKVKSRYAVVAQLVEHVLGKNEVSGSIPDNGSRQEVWQTI